MAVSRKVIFTKMSIGSLVAALDPNYNAREVGYRFSNGRQFASPKYGSDYETKAVSTTAYTIGVEDVPLVMVDSLRMLSDLEMK